MSKRVREVRKVRHQRSPQLFQKVIVSGAGRLADSKSLSCTGIGTRLRTTRAVASNSSTDVTSTRRSDVDCAGLINAEHCQRTAQAKKYRNAEREVEELFIVEEPPHPPEERVVDRGMVGGESLGILDR